MSAYADVALPLGVDQTFTYLVPPDLQDRVQPGVRVLVPFGTRYATGLVISRPVASPVTSLRPVRDVLDPEPVMSAELLHLCRWMAEYYLAPLGEVLKAAIPHGFVRSTHRLVHLAVPATDPRVARESAGTTIRARILRALAREGHLRASALEQRAHTRALGTHLHALQADGLVTVEEVLPGPRVKPKLVEMLDLGALDRAALAAALAAVPPRRKRDRRLLECIGEAADRGGRAVPLRDVLKSAGAGRAALRAHEESGLLAVTREEQSREHAYGTDEQTLRVILNDRQRAAVERIAAAIETGHHRTFLLHGVTGSGKTQVYIEAIRRCLAAGRSAVVLVPEIGLTPQAVRRFSAHFGDAVSVVHSRMTPGERHDAWRKALRGDGRVVIGPRSAVFSPVRRPGLIVVDEEHEASYKQFDATPRYHGRDVAVMRGALSNAVVVLGSATPSVESFFNARQGKYELIALPERVDQSRLPEVRIVDMTLERKRAYAALKESLPPEDRARLREFQLSSISPLLLGEITARLERREGVILLQNRRGFAPFVECVDCGWVAMCDRCNVTTTYHAPKQHLRCHYCGRVQPPPNVCPACGGIHVNLRGIGTQRVEEELSALLPGATTLRMDMDTTTRRGSHDRLLRQFGEGKADILLGTQMVAKGLDFPRVTLVGVVSADTQMLLPDFRASERTFQLLTQVAGRAGRSSMAGEVLIQTHQPAHHTLKHVLAHDYEGFYDEEIAQREELEYPPFSRLVLLEFKGKDEGKVQRMADRVRRLLPERHEAMTVLGPAPAVIARIRNRYRWHMLIKNSRRADPAGAQMRAAVRQALTAAVGRGSRSVTITVDVDPAGLL